MKILSKRQIKLKHQEDHTKTERNLMVKINCPFVVNIKFAFQDESQLYIVTDFMQGGDMFYHLHEARHFPDKTAKFYIAEIILAIEFLHKNNMVYRDLKPENILMDNSGHVKIADFGLSKILESSEDKAFTLCGTPQYLAPEILRNRGYDKSIDWWSLGCLLYEMLTGCLPFYIQKGKKLNPAIYEMKPRYPPSINEDAKNLINQLLVSDPKKRLGSGLTDAAKIKEHPYFSDIDWDKLWNKQITPPFIPQLSDELDLRYFDKMFTDEPVNSNRPTVYSRSRGPSEYKGFTYVTQSVSKEMIKLADGEQGNEEKNIKEEEKYGKIVEEEENS